MRRRNKVNSTTHNQVGITASQELLLRASILKTQDAISAWNAFKESVDIDSIDPASLRMLPLLYRNLLFHRVEDQEMDRLKGVYRLTWYKNQMLFYRMQSVLNLFHEAGIRTMILKGAALSLLYYQDRGVRPMADFDVMVRTEDLQPAIDILEKSGWKALDNKPLNALTQKVRHAHGFSDNTQNQFDLHWHLLPEFCTDDSDKDFWDKAVTLNFDGVPTATLSHTDHLFHILMHGAEWNKVSTLRWVADAAVIMDKARGSIDWQRLAGLARALSLSLAVKSNLRYLSGLLNCAVPQELMREIEAIPVSRLEERAYQAKLHSYGFMGILRADYLRYLIYARPDSGRAFSDTPAAFLRFLKYYWGKESLWQLPAPMVLKTLKRMRL